MDALEGDTVASALFAVGRRATRISQLRGEPRGIFCNMGVCFECLVEINGCPNQRACRTPVVNGMTVVTQVGPGTWGHEVGAVS